MRANIRINGFDELIEKLAKRGEDIDHVTNRTLIKCSVNANKVIHQEAQKHSVSGKLQSAIQEPKIIKGANSYTLEIGFDKEGNPEGTTHAIFINYGTPRRKEHGKIEKSLAFTNAFRRARTACNKVVKEELKKLEV